MRSIVKKILFCGAKGFPSISGYSRVVPVPEPGQVRVFVGSDIDMMCKFEMEANYLNHPLFLSLLELSAEKEFGYSYDGALRIACDVDLFHYLLHLLETSNPSAHYMDLSDLISKFNN
ncbi:auxin-responsive protein SAUR71-like [Argentina anserina]|uniref:auxin-responsive protein SAUR71-like n=1 Tax=Argentina anserina TaxID=57926 RepID=UPI0021764BF0|nr:auxin-responsive protein SAUR71-like [Potentilla anserina]